MSELLSRHIKTYKCRVRHRNKWDCFFVFFPITIIYYIFPDKILGNQWLMLLEWNKVHSSGQLMSQMLCTFAGKTPQRVVKILWMSFNLIDIRNIQSKCHLEKQGVRVCPQADGIHTFPRPFFFFFLVVRSSVDIRLKRLRKQRPGLNSHIIRLIIHTPKCCG